MPLLEVENLSIAVNMGNRLLPVVQGISFKIEAHQALGIAGESGCGKSLTCLGIMGLMEGTPIRITGGSIRFAGDEIIHYTGKMRRALMGNRMAMIFQEPMSSLNPVYTVGYQITEAILQHQSMSRSEARELAVELLADVRIPSPELRQHDYPHQLSGGLRQRVMIAIALSCKPDLLIADEPTTALDVTIQAQILDLISELQASHGMSLLLISHDLGVIARTCGEVAVMYCGRIVEYSSTDSLFAAPRHPYTVGLMHSIPNPDQDVDRLNAIAGSVPSLTDEMPMGCAFLTRCPKAAERCSRPFEDSDFRKSVLCHFPHEAVA